MSIIIQKGQMKQVVLHALLPAGLIGIAAALDCQGQTNSSSIKLDALNALMTPHFVTDHDWVIHFSSNVCWGALQTHLVQEFHPHGQTPYHVTMTTIYTGRAIRGFQQPIWLLVVKALFVPGVMLLFATAYLATRRRTKPDAGMHDSWRKIAAPNAGRL